MTAYKSADSYHSQQTTAGLISVKTLKSTCFNALINAWSLLGGINQTFLSCTSLILFQPQQINWSKWQTGSQRCDILSMWLESQFNCVYFSWVNLKYFISTHCIIISFYLFKLVHILLLLHLILFHNIPLHIFLFISFKLFYFTPSVICFCGGVLSEFHSSLYYSANLRFCYSFFIYGMTKRKTGKRGQKHLISGKN